MRGIGKVIPVLLGKKSLSNQHLSPSSTYYCLLRRFSTLSPDGTEYMIPGHIFLIKTADGQSYGKIVITSLSKEEDVRGFNWVSLD